MRTPGRTLFVMSIVGIVVLPGLTLACGKSPAGPDGSSSRLPAGYRDAPLKISRVEPIAGRSGDSVRIIGVGFAPGASVTMGGIAARILFSDNFSTIDAIVPDHDGGVSDVVVTNPSGGSVTLSSGFRFTTVRFSVSTNAVTAGGDLTVNWTVPPQAEPRRPEEGILLMNISTGKISWTSDTSGTNSGTRTLRAPTEPGEYEFQYRDFDDFVAPYFRILGRSRPLIVTGTVNR